MAESDENPRLTELEQRVALLDMATLSAYQRLLFIALQTVFPVFGVVALVTSGVIWWQTGLTAAFANMQLYIDLTVGLLMVISVVLWGAAMISKLLSMRIHR